MKKVKKEDVINLVEKICSNIKFENDMLDNNLEDYGIDSLNFIKLLVVLEEEFDIDLPIDVISLEKFNTVNKIYFMLKEFVN